MKVAAVQMVSGLHVTCNLRLALDRIAQAAQLGCELIALPEYFCLLGTKDSDKLAIAEEFGHGVLQDALRKAASTHHVWIVAGTLPLRGHQPHRVFNTSLAFDPMGNLVARYDKMHLFAFDNGVERYDEARVLQAGSCPVAFTLPSKDGLSWRVGMSVCYDLRFPELYRKLQADIFLIPSAFTHTTGRDHWETLLRARAIENLAYVVAPAQGGTHENGRRTWGHSMIIDAWGRILAERPDGEGLICADLDHALMQQARTHLPALNHRLL
jgi:deaminated glutathione amidase